MQIIQINASYKPAYIYGGPTLSVSKLCESLSANMSLSDKLMVLTTTANGEQELDVKTQKIVNVVGVQVMYFPRLTKDHSHLSPSLLSFLNKQLTKKNAKSSTIVHIHAWWNLVSILSCWVAKWRKIPVIISPRGMLTSYTLNNRNSFFKKIIHYTVGKRMLEYSHIHATTENEKKDILEIIQPKSITVLPNVVSFPINFAKANNSAASIQEKTKTFKLLFLSRIEEKKGVELLLTALSMLTFPWTLTIAGEGTTDYVQSLKKMAADLKISHNIQWIGQVTNEKKFDLLADHDLFCLTSYNENFANVVIESLSVGTPVLISEFVGLADYVKSNKLGWICSLDPISIAENITEAFKAKEMRESIRNHSPKIIQADYVPEVLAQKYMSMYHQILDSNN